MTAAPFESEATQAPQRRAAVTDALVRWRHELATVGGPNTLLWYADHPDGVLDLTTAHPGGVSMLLAGRPTRLSDLVRERVAFAEARGVAARIRARALELRSLRGLDTCFLTAGMATWEHPGAPAPPRAPVLLRSCTLRPTDATARDVDVVLGDEVELNPVLEEYLRSTAGIEVDAVSLAQMSVLSSGFDPYRVYAALARLCGGLPGFTVGPRILVGTFPHGKLAMVQDLADLAEPASVERLTGHTVLPALAQAGARRDGTKGRGSAAASEGIPVEPPADLDPDPDPAGERLVLDADSAQGGVVEAVLHGHDVVVEAPPGTGATQTVANLVAALAGQRNSVLLVAQQRSEIDDVRERLDSVGLGSVVFDAGPSLFDRRGTLEQVVARVDGLPTSSGMPAATPAGVLEERLRMHRDALRDHVAALHETRMPWSVSVHEVQGAIARLGARAPAPASRVRLRGAALARVSRERLGDLAEQLAEAARAGAWSGDERGDPWFGARITTEEEVARAHQAVSRLAGGGFDEQAAALDGILAESGLPPARTVGDWRVALATMAGVRETLEVFRPEVFDVPLDEHVAATAPREYRRTHGVELSWATRSRVRKLATRLLRPGRPPEDLHGELVKARTQRAAWYALVGAGGRPEISPRLDEAQAAFDDIDADLTWLGERLATTAAGGEVDAVPLEQLRERLAVLASHPDRLAVLPRAAPVLDDLRAAGMSEVVDDFAARGVEAEQVTAELEYIWWVSIARHVAESDSRYGGHNGAALRKAAEEYRTADRERLAAFASRTRADVAAWHREAALAHETAAATLRAEAGRAGRPASLRTAFEASPGLLLGIAPCWATSPLTVAEAVPPGQWFDVVIVLGAGTVTAAETVSALARARQVVVVGDSRLGGPTSFEASIGPAVIPAREAAPASLLDDLTGVLPVHRLRWAHGHTDDRLWELAGELDDEPDDDLDGERRYGRGIVAAPGPDVAAPVRLDLVDGRADVEPGGDATVDSTDAEVDRVVELVLEHARTRPDQSLAVVALTDGHAERVRSALALAVDRLDPGADEGALAFLAADAPRPVVVVPMAVATGLSRDVVLLTVGYGKTPHGWVLHRFPVLSAPDARRQLTAAVTAARRQLTVVSSIAPDELDHERLRDQGVALKALLSRAGRVSGPPEPGVDQGADSLAADLASRLRREGLVVAEGVGTRRRVDLGVTDPAHEGRWLVAVETDGPGYASWRGTRERDRLWPEGLERRGWRHVQVWSTDLYRDPAREVARVVAAVREVSNALGTAAGPDPDGPRRRPLFFRRARRVATGGNQDSQGEGQGAAAAAATGAGGPAGTGAGGPAGTAAAPDQTRDDTDSGWGEPAYDDAHDRWLHEQRPPHWG